MKFTFLGTGTSHGIPVIGCTCSVCRSKDPRNKRRRCSLYIRAGHHHFVVDTPPDFREQVLSFGVERVDALFLTHPHADHIFGFDDIRRFSLLQNSHIPVFGDPETIHQMRKKFDYVDKASHSFGGVPRVKFIEQTHPVVVGGTTITPLPVQHGHDLIYGLRFEAEGRRLAYIPDCNGIPEKTWPLLENLDVMILDGLRPKPHPTHFTIDECAETLARISARQSFITHITHNSDHSELQHRLGPAVTVPWDGLEIEL